MCIKKYQEICKKIVKTSMGQVVITRITVDGYAEERTIKGLLISPV